MKKYSFVVSAMLVGALLGAEPVKSGPQVGEKVPGPFRPLNVTGAHAGEKFCLFCANGSNPVVMIFAREDTPAVRELVKKVDAATAANHEARLGSCAIFLTDTASTGVSLKAFADKEGLKHTVLAVNAPTEPARYAIAADAAVTVLLYRHATVKANHSFRSGELTEAGVNAVVADLPKILAAE